MDYLLIYDDLKEHLKSRFPNRRIEASIGRNWHDYRFIQLSSPLQDSNIHYEYRRGHVELHFEREALDNNKQLIDYLMRSTESINGFLWDDWDKSIHGVCCQWGKFVSNVDEFDEAFDFIIKIFDPLISDYQNASELSEIFIIKQCDTLPELKDKVDLFTLPARNVLSLPLALPEYQRIYCWEEHNVKGLLDDIFSHIEKPEYEQTSYRLGSIILHKHDGRYDIIDGQQRLVTLSIILQNLGVDTQLLNEKFVSSKAGKYVAYNKYLINSYLQRHFFDKKRLLETVLDRLEFSVLVLQNASLDLAYTFFSNENSRGVGLTDYDLLKAHHLRYIPFEKQSKKAAENWNRMIEEGRINEQNNEAPDYERALDSYMYKLRRWIRNKDVEDGSDNRRVKREYEAAPIIEEIPPFGEHFYFAEPIQGGNHFFSFVEHHLLTYKHFIQTQEYRILHAYMTIGTAIWYRDAIEATLFGYYCKFGETCLADALVISMRIILQHRFQTERTRKDSIMKYVGDIQLVKMIDSATSPTFFLAEARNQVREFPIIYLQELRPVQKALKNEARQISKKLENIIIIDSFKSLN